MANSRFVGNFIISSAENDVQHNGFRLVLDEGVVTLIDRTPPRLGVPIELAVLVGKPLVASGTSLLKVLIPTGTGVTITAIGHLFNLTNNTTSADPRPGP